VAVVAVAVLAAAGYVGWRAARSSTSTGTSTTSSTLPPVIAPLTGLADASGLSHTRPALTVKIENIPAAMPQRGIEQADVIYEEIVEGGITRLAAIFNSHAPPEIGPVRSVRRTDKWIVWPIGGIFAYSGGAAYAVNDIATAPVHTVDETEAGPAMFRDNNGRVPPNNLYAIGPKMFALGGHPVPPPPLFTYRGPADPLEGPKVQSFVVGFGSGYTVSFAWNPSTESWDRTQFGAPDVTASGARLSPKNVIVMDVGYLGGVGQLGAQAVLVGAGHCTVFVGGREVIGTWRRPSREMPAVYYDSANKVIKLTPGQTWVELLYYKYPLTVTLAPTTTTTTAP
jgi:hypothetical protein